MLYDLRTTARGGGSLRDIRERIVPGVAGGVFQTEVGTAGQIVILLPHEESPPSGAGRARGEGGEGGEARLAVGGFGKHELEILQSVPSMPPLEPRELGRVYELRWFDHPPGSVPEILDAFEAALKQRESVYPVAGCWTVEVGPNPDRVYVLLPYKDWDHRDEIRAALASGEQWPPRTPVPALSSGAKLLLPVQFSPLR